MENYLKEIIEICGLPFSEVLGDTKVIFIGGKALYVGNYRKVIAYGKDQIDLRIKKDVLHVLGDDLMIKQLDKNEIFIAGKITGVMVGDYAKK